MGTLDLGDYGGVICYPPPTGVDMVSYSTDQDALADLALGDEQLSGVRLLISDVVMPNINGRELARRLGERIRGLRVLLISGYADQLSAEQGFLDGGIQFLPKPYSPESLLARARALLDEGSG